MSQRRNIITSTPKCAKMVASNPLLDEDLDSILVDGEKSQRKKLRKNARRNDNDSVILSETDYSDATSSVTGAKIEKTVTPQNDVEIEPEPIKQRHLSIKKAQSRLTNSSVLNSTSLDPKEPSLPLGNVNDNNGDEGDVESGTDSGSDSVANGVRAVNNKNKELINNVSKSTKAKESSDLSKTQTDQETNSKSVSNKKKDNAENSNSTEKSAKHVSVVDLNKSENVSKLLNDSKSKSKKSLATGSDSDSDETPKTRKNVSGNSNNPNETFKKKLFKNYKENGECSSSIQIDTFQRKCSVRLNRIDFGKIQIKQPISANDSNDEESEMKSGKDTRSHLLVSKKALSKLGNSRLSKEKFLNNWVDEQKSLRTNRKLRTQKKRYYDSDDSTNDEVNGKKTRRSKRLKNHSDSKPLRVQPKRTANHARRGEIQEIILSENDEESESEKNGDTEVKIVTKKNTVKKTNIKKTKTDDIEVVNNVKQKRGRPTKRVINENNDSEKKTEPVKQQKLTVKIAKPSVNDNQTKKLKSAKKIVKVTVDEDDSDNVPLIEVVKKTEKSRKKSEEIELSKDNNDDIEPIKKITRRGAEKRKITINQKKTVAEPTKKIKIADTISTRSLSQRNAKKPTIVEKNAKLKSTKIDSDTEVEKKLSRGRPKRIIKQK